MACSAAADSRACGDVGAWELGSQMRFTSLSARWCCSAMQQDLHILCPVELLSLVGM